MSRYKSTKVKGRRISVHRLVWEKAHGPIPKGYEIHHKDGNGNNNDLSNLELLTCSEHKALHARLRAAGCDVVDPTNPDVIRSREKSKQYRTENKEKVRARQMEYYYEHHEERLAYCKKYRDEHAEEVRARSRRYRANNLDKIMAYNAAHRDQAQAWRDAHKEEAKAYREKNKDTIRMMHAKYRKENREIVNALWNLNRARKLGLPKEKIAEYEEKVRRAKAAKGKLE